MLNENFHFDFENCKNCRPISDQPWAVHKIGGCHLSSVDAGDRAPQGLGGAMMWVCAAVKAKEHSVIASGALNSPVLLFAR
jgi:hypothetical protein